MITSNYPFLDFIQRLIRIVDEDPENYELNKICEIEGSSYKGEARC